MEKKNEESEIREYSAKFLRRRKFLLIAPVLIVPFLVLALWTTGLVGNAQGGSKGRKGLQGFNLNLPSAAPAKDSNWNKLRYYEQADKDSAKLRSQMRRDPFFQSLEDEEEQPSMNGVSEAEFSEMLYDSEKSPYSKKLDRNEQKVYQKLSRLQRELDRKPEETVSAAASSNPSYNPDVEKLENMMHQMNQEKAPDTELLQLNGMLEKIMDIQNPERVQEKLRQQSEKNKMQAFALETPPENVVSRLEPRRDLYEIISRNNSDTIPETLRSYQNRNRFFSLVESETQTQQGRSIPASIPEAQTLVSGATIKMRLLEEIFVAGIKIPKNHFVYGKATLNGDRLQIEVSSIEYNNRILPVALTVYDKKDGLSGIDIPGAITRDVAKRSAAQSVQGLGTLGTLDPSFGAQMATAGLNMAQNLVGRTTKLVRVTVAAGYQVLLRDDNKKSNNF